MPRIVYITNAMSSTLNSSFEFSRRLVEAGYEVVYLSHVDISEQVNRYGYEAYQLTRDKEIDREFQAAIHSIGPRRTIQGVIERWKLGRQFFERSATQTEIEDKIAELSPDLLVIDIECHYAILACRKLGIPILLPIVWHTIFRHGALPPLHTNLLPTGDLISKLRIASSWSWLLAKRAIGQLVSRIRSQDFLSRLRPVRYGTNRRSDLARIAALRNDRISRITDWTHWLHPHVYNGMTVLSFNAYEFEFPHQKSIQIEYVGPMVFENRIDLDRGGSAEWQKFRQQIAVDNRRLVYCSLGTFWSTNREFLKKLVSVFARRDEWGLVIGLGGKSEPEDLGSLPDNVLVMKFAPQIDILKSADAAITHGGITSINECLQFGVPVLCCSTGFVDQNGCCARVVYHGVGLRAQIESISVAQLEEYIEEILTNESMRSNVEAMQHAIDGYRQRRSVEDIVSKLIKNESREVNS